MESIAEIRAAVREARSSESNFDRIVQELEKAIALAQKEGNQQLSEELQEVADKYVGEYQKAKETGGSAWPEFENFVTQFERALTGAGKQ